MSNKKEIHLGLVFFIGMHSRLQTFKDLLGCSSLGPVDGLDGNSTFDWNGTHSLIFTGIIDMTSTISSLSRC